MTKNEVLNQLNQKKMSKRQAYKLLYGKQKVVRPRRASFVKLSIRIPEEKWVSVFLSVLFFLPIPIFIFKLFIRGDRRLEISESVDISAAELIRLISIKGAHVSVKTHDHFKINIRTI
jgi:hypothetical protein